MDDRRSAEGWPDRPEIDALWREAVSCLPDADGDLETILTFGSVSTGDFAYLVYEERAYLSSDFEFSIVMTRDPPTGKRAAILDRIDAFNARYAGVHVGFHMNAKVQTAPVFLEGLKHNPYFHNSILRTGRVVRGTRTVLDAVRQEGERALAPEDLSRFFKQVIDSLLMQLDPGFVVGDPLHRLFVFHVIAKDIAKMAFIYAARSGRFLTKLSEALAWIAECPDQVVIGQALRRLAAYRIDRESGGGGRDLVGDALVVVDDLFEWCGRHARRRPDLEDSYRALREVLEEVASSPNARWSHRSDERRKGVVRTVLRGKAEHYKFYKDRYAVA